MHIQRHFLWLPLLLVSACANGASTGANITRSPSLDYHPHATQTSDGQIVGADRAPPDQKLATSPKVGNGGFAPAATRASVEGGTPAAAPAAPLPTTTSDPECDALGMKDAARKANCQKAPPPPPQKR